jgi:hypothetical protein
MLLLLVRGDNFLEAQFEDCDRVRKFLLKATLLFAAGAACCGLRLVKGLIIKFNGFIPFLKAFLQFLDL